jgi:peptide/nickel transport system ATP-binding protein
MLVRNNRRLLTVTSLAVEFVTPRGLVHGVRDVSLHVNEGEVIGVVGESGSGKSVTAYSVLGLLPPNGRVAAGAIDYMGQDLLKVAGKVLKAKRGNDISMIFQSPQTALNPIRPIGAQIADVLMTHQRLPRKAARQRAIAALEAVEIGNAAERFHNYPFEFSGGMCQRALIAMALACQPRLLLADEPTTGLDVTTQKTVMDLLVTLTRSRNMSTLFITHDLGLAALYCDRIVIMRNGEIVEQGATAQIFNAPRDSYTKRLLAATPQLHSRLVDLLPPAERRPFLASGNTGEGQRDRAQADGIILQVHGLVREYDLGKAQRSLRERLRLSPPAERSAPRTLRAVDGISFHVAAGECVGLVGESGCGKTTTSRLIAKLLKPTAGSIRLLGKEIGAEEPHRFARSPMRRLIQMVFQDPSSSLDPHRTAFEAIADPLLLLEGVKRPAELRRRIEAICDLADLPTGLLDRFPHQLSGGQKARVGIARAIAVNPALVVLDEPTSALDVSVQAVVLNQLDKLKRELGLSYLFVSHDLNVVRLLCDRILVMRSGRIVEQGSPAALFSAPGHDYTKQLLRAVPQIPRMPHEPGVAEESAPVLQE